MVEAHDHPQVAVQPVHVRPEINQPELDLNTERSHWRKTPVPLRCPSVIVKLNHKFN